MSKRIFVLTVFIVALLGIHPRPASAAPIPFKQGDVIAGVGNGQLKHFDSNGHLLATLDTTSGSAEQTGMCFDSAGNLYTTNFQAQNMSKFDNQGQLVKYPWGDPSHPFSLRPKSCLVDAAGYIYTSEVDGQNIIRKFDSSGKLLLKYGPAAEDRGIDWM